MSVYFLRRLLFAALHLCNVSHWKQRRLCLDPLGLLAVCSIDAVIELDTVHKDGRPIKLGRNANPAHTPKKGKSFSGFRSLPGDATH